MPKMTPEREAAYALNNNLSRASLKPEVQVEYDRLRAERIAALPAQPPPPPPRFPSAPETRREILDAIASKNEKFARPFDHGRVASYSRMGTDSWAEYGEVVLQMAILDTLLSIEEKLSASENRPASKADPGRADDTTSPGR
jgi:hypothetical protein